MDGLLASPWDKYLPPNTPEDAYSDLSQKMKYQPMNWQRLLDSGAIRITQPGGGTGPEPIITSDPNQFSLVTMHNDQGDSYTKKWPDKPESYKIAMQEIGKPGFLYDGKYRQILWSARQLGLSPEDVFVQQKPSGTGILGSVK